MSEALRKRIYEADLIIVGLMSGDKKLEAKALEMACEYMATYAETTYADDWEQSEFENPKVIFP